MNYIFVLIYSALDPTGGLCFDSFLILMTYSTFSDVTVHGVTLKQWQNKQKLFTGASVSQHSPTSPWILHKQTNN